MMCQIRIETFSEFDLSKKSIILHRFIRPEKSCHVLIVHFILFNIQVVLSHLSESVFLFSESTLYSNLFR